MVDPEDQLLLDYIDAPEIDLYEEDVLSSNEIKVLTERLDVYLDECERITTPSEKTCTKLLDFQLKNNNTVIDKYLSTFEYEGNRDALKTEVNDLEEKFTLLQKNAEKAREKREEHQKKTALYTEILQTYSSLYKFVIIPTRINTVIYKVVLNFKLSDERLSPPITFKLNMKTKKVEDFDASKVLSSEQETLLRRWYSEKLDLPKLICSLRSYLLK